MPRRLDAASRPATNLFAFGRAQNAAVTGSGTTINGGLWAWNSWAGPGGANAYTFAVAAPWSLTGYAIRATWSTAPTAFGGDIGMSIACSAGSNGLGGLQPNTTYYAAITVVCSKAQRLMANVGNYYTASGAAGSGTTVSYPHGQTRDLQAGVPTTFSAVFTTGANTTNAKFYVGNTSGGAGSMWAVGDTLDASMGVLVQGSTPPCPLQLFGGYFDGTWPTATGATGATGAQSVIYPWPANWTANLTPDPRFTSLTGWDAADNGAGAALAVSALAAGATPWGPALRATWSAAETASAAAGGRWIGAKSSNAYGVPAQPGGTYSMSCWVRSSRAQVAYVQSVPRDSSNAAQAGSGGGNVTLTPGVWSRLTVTGFTAPATTETFLLRVNLGNPTDGVVGLMQAGDTVDLAAPMVNPGNTAQVYADGATPGWSWLGATKGTGPAAGPAYTLAEIVGNPDVTQVGVGTTTGTAPTDPLTPRTLISVVDHTDVSATAVSWTGWASYSAGSPAGANFVHRVRAAGTDQCEQFFQFTGGAQNQGIILSGTRTVGRHVHGGRWNPTAPVGGGAGTVYARADAGGTESTNGYGATSTAGSGLTGGQTTVSSTASYAGVAAYGWLRDLGADGMARAMQWIAQQYGTTAVPGVTPRTMAYTTGSDAAAVTAHTITLPACPISGRYRAVLATTGAAGALPTITPPAGWTQVLQSPTGTTAQVLIFERTAQAHGDEAGATVTFTGSAATTSLWLTLATWGDAGGNGGVTTSGNQNTATPGQTSVFPTLEPAQVVAVCVAVGATVTAAPWGVGQVFIPLTGGGLALGVATLATYGTNGSAQAGGNWALSAAAPCATAAVALAHW